MGTVPASPHDLHQEQIQARLQEALGLHQQGRLAEAEAGYGRVLALQPEHAAALNLLGVIATQTGQARRAVELISRALAADPGQALYAFSLGNALGDLGEPARAVASYDRALELDPGFTLAHHNRGIALQDLGRAEEALAAFDRALALDPRLPDTWFERGNVLQALHRPEAVASYEQALALAPGHFAAEHNRACALLAGLDWTGALAGFDRTLALAPQYAPAWGNRGIALLNLDRPQEALVSQDRAIALDPGSAQHHCNRGNVLQFLLRLDAAQSSYARALELQPDLVETQRNLGRLNLERGRLKEALTCFDHALALDAGDAESLTCRGNAHFGLKQLRAARADYDRAFALEPRQPFLAGTRLLPRMQLCDWDGLEAERAALLEQVRLAEPAALPFPFLALSDDPALQAQAGATWARHLPPVEELGPIPPRPRRERIRVGFYASTFHNHPMASLLSEFFELHDRERFEFIAFSYGPPSDHPARKRLVAAFDRFIDVRERSDREVAELSRQLEVDIAIDRNGYTSDARTLIFAYRAAPIQVNYLAYPGSMGADFIDYLVADDTVIHPGSRPHFPAKVVYLPDCYQGNDRLRPVSERAFSRAELGLPPQGFVFCCFNNSFKITPETFQGWMRILGRVEGSVLWLLEDNPEARANLTREAARLGLAPERLVFAPRLEQAEHLARHRQAGLFLDTLPFNAHTTASDALWTGLPVLTRLGESFPARVAASLLKAVGLPELITTSQQAYEELAVALATSPERLEDLRARLAAQRLSAPLFDCERFTRNFERACEAMLERHHAGLPPGDIRI